LCYDRVVKKGKESTKNVSFRRCVFLYPNFQGGDSIGQDDPGKGVKAKALKRVSFFVPENRRKMRKEARYERV